MDELISRCSEYTDITEMALPATMQACRYNAQAVQALSSITGRSGPDADHLRFAVKDLNHIKAGGTITVTRAG